MPRRIIRILSWLCLILSLPASCFAEEKTAAAHSLTITAAVDCSENLLVRFSPPATLPALPARQHWELENVNTRQKMTVQTRKLPCDNRTELLWRLDAPLPAKQSREYRLRAAVTDSATADRRFHIQQADGNYVLQENTRPLLVYNSETDPPPAGVSPLYARSGYIHPLYSPAGKILTDDFPPDHYHQHGLFFAWVNTTVGSTPVDFWNQGKGQGTVRHEKVLRAVSGPVFAELAVELSHVKFPHTENEQMVLREEWEILLHRSEEVTVWELFSEQWNVAEVPVTLEKYHYGGFGTRGSRDWSPQKSGGTPAEFLTSAGKNRQQGNHTAAEWVRMSGPLTESDAIPAVAGVVILSHPDNLRATQKVRLHPSMPYFCFCPVVEAQYVMEPGESLRSRYLLIMFDGELSPAKIDSLRDEYFSPPEVKMTHREE